MKTHQTIQEFIYTMTMRIRVRVLMGLFGFLVVFIGVLRFLSSDLAEVEASASVAAGVRKKINNNEQGAEQINLNELFFVGDCLLREAGKRIVSIRQQAGFKFEHKKDTSVVTKADLESHTIIVHTLESKFKRLRVHSEENGAVTGNNFDLAHYLAACDRYVKQSSDLYTSVENIQVWIDPLDATQEYSGLN
jgi:hypothetical protein